MRQMRQMSIARTALLSAALAFAGAAGARARYIVEPGKGPERAVEAGDPLAYVDPFIGSGGTGHTTPAAAYPFGMVQPGPDTSHDGWGHCSAYQYGDGRIARFSQNHLSGTGCSEFTDVAFMPAAGDPAQALARDYRAGFDKKTESASPGYYAVTLDCGTKVEATCTRRVSLFRFTFPRGKQASLLFDPSWSFARIRSAEIVPLENRCAAGHVDRHGWPGHEYWFAWELSAAPVDARQVQAVKAEKGIVPKYVYTFDTSRDNVVCLKVSLSRTSAEGARRNIDRELPGWDFDAVRAAGQDAWRGIVGRIRAKGTRNQLTSLYTSVYHLCFQPNTISDVDEPDLYSTFSCWDTYRAAGPLYTLLTPEYVPAFVNSMLWHFDRNGFLPVWTLWGGDNQCMVGVHSVPMIVDAYLKGFKGVDWEKAYACVRATLREDRGRWIANYALLDRYGYYPCDIVKEESVSRLLENCYDDACAYRMARALGRQEDARFFRARSRAWTRCHDPQTGFIRARDSKGNWREPFDPYRIHGEGHHNYTEGNAFHWNWHVMQDPDLLIDRLGGREAALRRLLDLFNEDPGRLSAAPPDVTGLVGQYCHGNEPSHHDIYFFTLLGRRDLAAKYIREVMDTQYQTTPEGLCGNDDCGQMSAWYIFSAMGLYPFDPCGGGYVLGEAQMEEISLDVGNGRRFTVLSEMPGEASARVELDGRRFDGVKIAHGDILKGGQLAFRGGRAGIDYVFDITGAPELEAWTRQQLAPLVRRWYPRLTGLFASEGFRPPEEIRFDFKSGIDCPAYTSGNRITFNRAWIGGKPDDLGCAIHELFHVVQGGYRKAPGWLTEGIADYVRFYLYEPATRGCDMDLLSREARYDGKYRISANFLDFVERRHPGVVKELNALCRQGTYDEETYWPKRTGRTVKELEREWKKQGEGPFRFYRFAIDGTKGRSDCMQLSEIELLDAKGGVVTADSFKLNFDGGGDSPDGETPAQAVDGDRNTKWLDFRAASNAKPSARARVSLTFAFDSPVKLSGYRWYTANDFENRDPAGWRMLGSNDGTAWTVIDRVRGFRAPSERRKLAATRTLRR